MDNKDLVKLMKKFKFLKKKTLPAGIECGKGWDAILKDLFQTLNEAEHSSDFVITRVYSTMDELRLFTKCGNNTTRFAIEKAVERSQEVCEACGNEKDLGLCEKCKYEPAEENDIAAILNPPPPPAATPAPGGSCGGGCSGGGCGGSCGGQTPPPATP